MNKGNNKDLYKIWYLKDTIRGEYWFVNDTSTCRLREEGDYWDVCGLLKGHKKAYAYVNRYAATSATSFIYGVENKEALELANSGVGSLTNYFDDGTDITFELIIDEYDCLFDPSMGTYLGHSFKPYYFYFDNDTDEIMEYVGYELTDEELDDLCGFELTQELIDRNYVIINAYNRDNGIVTVNYYIKNEDDSISYDQVNWDNNTKTYVDAFGGGNNILEESGFGGTYQY